MSQDSMNKDRYAVWFDPHVGFVSKTDEKEKTKEVLSEIVMALRSYSPSTILKNGSPINIMDVGSGTGVLTAALSEDGYAVNPEGSKSYALDMLPEHVKLTHNALQTVSRKFESHQSNVIAANVGHNSEPLHLDVGAHDGFDIILASHVAYYPDEQNNLSAFTNQILRSLSNHGLAIFVHDSNNSDIVPLKEQYGELVESETPKNIQAEFSHRGQKTMSFQFASTMSFPKISDEDWERLKQAENYSLDHNPYPNQELLSARALAEFIVHKPLEDMEEGKRSDYIDELKRLVEDKNYELQYNNTVQVAVSPKASMLTKRGIERAVMEVAKQHIAMPNVPNFAVA